MRPQPQIDVNLEHIPTSRLFCVTIADNLDFTDTEVDHLKSCSPCFEQWKQYIFEFVSAKEVASHSPEE
jgi:hypothetical protein